MLGDGGEDDYRDLVMYDDWRRELDERFPERDPDMAQREWDDLRSRLAIGQSLTGVVVTKAGFGAWLDLGLGFPGLIYPTGLAEMTAERYRAGEWCPVGSEVTAFVVDFEQFWIPRIMLSQKPWHVGRRS